MGLPLLIFYGGGGGCGLEDFFLGGGHLVFRGNGGEREESTATEYKRRTIEN